MAASKSTRLSIGYSIDGRQVVRQGLDLDGVGHVQQRAARGVDRLRRADRHERDVDGHLLGHPHEEQVHVDDPPIHRVDLDALDEDRLGLLAVDRQVHQGVGARVAAEELEVVGVDREVARVDAVTVDHRGQAPGLAEAADGLAGDVAMLGGQRRAGSGHGMRTSGCGWVRRYAGCGSRARLWRGRPEVPLRVPRSGTRAGEADVARPRHPPRSRPRPRSAGHSV